MRGVGYNKPELSGGTLHTFRCNCLCIPMTMRFQESRMSGDLLVRFDEGEWVARKCRPLSYSTYLKASFKSSNSGEGIAGTDSTCKRLCLAGFACRV